MRRKYMTSLALTTLAMACLAVVMLLDGPIYGAVIAVGMFFLLLATMVTRWIRYRHTITISSGRSR